MARKSGATTLAERRSYNAVLADVTSLLETARSAAARAVNTVMTAAYWQIGRRIVEAEMGGRERAEYGEGLIDRLAGDLTARFGRGFSRRAVYQMRAFYRAYPMIVQSAIAQSDGATAIVQSPTAQSGRAVPRFPLPWTHYVQLLSVEDEHARKFYETEALRGGWTVKQLRRQINSMFYERTALSRNKAAMLTRHNRAKPEDAVTAEEQIKDRVIEAELDKTRRLIASRSVSRTTK